MILVLDDVQWAEAALLDLVEHVAQRADGPLLLLCMARPELLDARPDWGEGAVSAESVRLDSLAPEDADALVDALLGGAPLPEEARERITSAADGNPLFLEEVLRMLVDEGRLIRDGDAWTVEGDVSSARIPPTVSAAFLAPRPAARGGALAARGRVGRGAGVLRGGARGAAAGVRA